MRIHEPRRTTKGIRLLRRKVAEDPEFASLVFGLRELMNKHGASPFKLRAAYNLLLHGASWRQYKHEQTSEVSREDLDLE